MRGYFPFTTALSVLADAPVLSIHIYVLLLFAFVYIPGIFLCRDMCIRARFIIYVMCDYSGMYVCTISIGVLAHPLD